MAQPPPGFENYPRYQQEYNYSRWIYYYQRYHEQSQVSTHVTAVRSYQEYLPAPPGIPYPTQLVNYGDHHDNYQQQYYEPYYERMGTNYTKRCCPQQSKYCALYNRYQQQYHNERNGIYEQPVKEYANKATNTRPLCNCRHSCGNHALKQEPASQRPRSPAHDLSQEKNNIWNPYQLEFNGVLRIQADGSRESMRRQDQPTINNNHSQRGSSNAQRELEARYARYIQVHHQMG